MTSPEDGLRTGRNRSAAEALQARLPGRVSLPDEPGYAAASPWDQSAVISPAAVVAPHGVPDIAETLRFAAEHGLRVLVQATGHGAISADEDTVLIYTGGLQECTIDPAGRTARIGPGTTWQQIVDQAAPLGLAPVCGSSTGVGAVGYLTGGGIGPLVRDLGVSSDYVTAIDLVTADGRLHTTTQDSSEALSRAVRGGKSFLGVVAAMEIELLPIREVFGGAVFYPAEILADLLPRWREWAAGLPRRASTSLAVLRLPAVPAVPPPLAGQVRVAVRYASLDPFDLAERDFRPMADAAPAIFGGVGPMPYASVSRIHNDPVVPTPVVNDTTLLRDLPDDAVDAFVRLAGVDSGAPHAIIELRQLGGVLDEPSRVPSVFDTGGAAYNLYLSGDPRASSVEALAGHGRDVLAAMAGHSLNRKLINFARSNAPDALRQCLRPDDLAWLNRLGEGYDPTQVLTRPLAEAAQEAPQRPYVQPAESTSLPA